MRDSTTGNAVTTPQTQAETYILTWWSVQVQLDSINTSDLTATWVSASNCDAVRKSRNEILSSFARSNFCVKVNENITETYWKLKKTYGEHAVSRTHVFRRHKAFLDGRESVEDLFCLHFASTCSYLLTYVATDDTAPVFIIWRF